jgi:hypothetical protein
VVAEIAALKFKFDQDALPAAASGQAHGFAIGEAGLCVFDQLAELFRQLTNAMGMPLSRAWCGERGAVLRMPWPTCRIRCSYQDTAEQDTAEAGRTLNLKKRERNLPLSKRSFLQK